MAGKRRVVVTGLGIAAPTGIGIEPFWDALIEKRHGIRRIEAFDPSGLAAQVGGELPSFALGDHIPKSYRKSAKVMSRDIKIAMVCAYHAVKDAGLDTKCIIERGEANGPPNLDSRRFGANIGAGLICADLDELAGALATAADDNRRFSLTRWGAEGMSNLTPLWLLKFLPNMLACHVTIVHDAQAPSNTITCAEASSHLAIGEAFRTIARGDADVCICGGAESKINPMAIARPLLWGRLNTEDNDVPERASRPFGARRRGMVVAEGGGLVILESLDHARERGAKIYAEIVGFGAGADTNSWSTPNPKGAGTALALRKALADAGTTAERIDLVTPLGTGTVEHDATEMAAWNKAFGAQLDHVPAITSRGAIGNNGAGSGAIDFAATVVALHRNTVPPSPNTDDLDSGCRFRFVQGHPIDANITQAISVGYALAGTQSAALVIRRHQE
ncbi:MAG: beta-ketoacyl-[acyl-carrier-protein] synthase family protein [Phycisphaerales bacterium]|nr:MAG: beta-ketoacyl-[acyl-carrier-protein] synthase family protein [Phycisphaerales bacterium]